MKFIALALILITIGQSSAFFLQKPSEEPKPLENTSDVTKCIVDDLGHLINDLQEAISQKDWSKLLQIGADLYQTYQDCKKLFPNQGLVDATSMKFSQKCKDTLNDVLTALKNAAKKIVNWDFGFDDANSLLNFLVDSVGYLTKNCLSEADLTQQLKAFVRPPTV